MRPYMFWLFGIVLLATSPVIANDAAEKESASKAPATPSAAMIAQAEWQAQVELRVRKALRTRITREFDDAPLNDVLKFLAAQGKFLVVIDEAALVEEGIAWEEPVSHRLRDATIEQTLDRVLKPLALTWLIENEVLKVTTEVKAEDILITRVYNVRIVLDAGNRAWQCKPGVHEPFCGFGGNCVPACDAWLPDLIQNETTGPWQDIEGTGGTVDLAHDLFIVRHTRVMQDEVAALLAGMEAFVDNKLPGKATAVARHGFSLQDAACFRALQRNVSVNFRDTLLKDVAAHMERVIDAQVVVDERELNNEGIGVDEPITLAFDGLTAHSVLKNILTPLGLTYLVRYGVIEITTQIASEDILEPYLYDVRDLHEIGFDDSQLIEAIQKETTGPWQDVEGTGGTISEGPGMLVVRQTQQVQAEIAVLLDTMRKRAADAKAADRKLDNVTFDSIVLRFYSVQDINQATDLQEALTALIAPESWQAKESQAAIRIVGNTLVVRQTLRVQHEIAQFIQNLRTAESSAAGGSGIFSTPGGGFSR